MGEWKDICQKIDNEIDHIWNDEPIEATASEMRIFPSGAGSHGTCIGNLISQIVLTRAIKQLSGQVMVEFIKNDDFSLENCKAAFVTLFQDIAFELGGSSLDSDAAWLNLPNSFRFYQDIVASYDSIKSKDALAQVVQRWFIYHARLNVWLEHKFPWAVIGTVYQTRNIQSFENLLELTKATEIVMKNALISRI